jgi:hypothetical protein
MTEDRSGRPIVIGQLGFRVLGGVAKALRERKSSGLHHATPLGEQDAEQPAAGSTGEVVPVVSRDSQRAK